MSDLRARIANAILSIGTVDSCCAYMAADKIIAEFGMEKTSFVHCRAKEPSPGAVPQTVAAVSAPGEDLIDFGLWLSEEITGKPMTRIDLESCLQEWKRD